MTLKFTPPRLVNRYALFVDYGNGNGSLKLYGDLGGAKNAWYHQGRRSDSKILENVSGDWYVLFDIPAGTDRNNPPWYKEISKYSWRNRGESTYTAAKPMTRDEYAEWRIAVEHERIADLSGDLSLNYN